MENPQIDSNKKTLVFIDARSVAQDRLSGIGNLVINLINALLDDNEFLEKHELVLVHTKGEEKNLRKHLPDALTLKRLPFFSRRTYSLLNYLNLLMPIDLIIGRGVYLFPDYVNYPIAKGSRSVTWIHDLAFVYYPETVSSKLQKRLSKFVPKWAKRTDKIVTLTETVKAEIVEEFGIDPNKIVVVGCGVDREVFRQYSLPEIREAQTKYNLPERYILFVGNIEPRKNLKSLVEAYMLIEPTLRDNYKLVLVGSGGWNNTEINNAIEKANQDGNNIVRPNRHVEYKDLGPIMAGAKLLINPAIYEGFGMTPLEALASGTASAVSDLPVLREIYKDSVYYFDPNDPRDIVSALEKLILGKLGVLNAESIVSDYSWENAALQLKTVISKIEK